MLNSIISATKKFLLVGSLLLAASPAAFAQHAYWAGKVVKVSSQKSSGKEAFSPEQALGAPNSLPLGQINNNAWIPKKEGPNEFIEVKFARSVVAQQVTVVENFNPGSVIKIELVDTRGKTHEVYKNTNPGPLPEPYRTLEVTFPAGDYRTLGIIVTMNTEKVDGINQIDAIGMADVASTMVKSDFKTPTAATAGVEFDSTLINLGSGVNTRYVDTHPVISPNGKTLYFARQGHPGNTGGANDPQDVWYSTLTSGQRKTWGTARNMRAPINTPDEPNGVASVAASGQSVVLTGIYEDGFMVPKGFSISTRTRIGWGPPVKMDIEDFYNDDKDHVDCFLTTSGKALLMAVERKDGLGRAGFVRELCRQNGAQ